MQPTILLIQNDAEECSRLLAAFVSSAHEAHVYAATDGVEAFAYLSGSGKFADRAAYPVPQVILLDIDLAKESSFKVVRWLREEANHLNIPVIGITCGTDKSIIDRAYKVGATSCVLKDKEGSVLSDIATGLADYAALLRE
jgi:CheY-like chemotaxis protein